MWVLLGWVDGLVTKGPGFPLQYRTNTIIIIDTRHDAAHVRFMLTAHALLFFDAAAVVVTRARFLGAALGFGGT